MKPTYYEGFRVRRRAATQSVAAGAAKVYPPPEIPPSAYAPLPSGMPDDGLLLNSYKNAPLTVTIDISKLPNAIYGENDFVYLYLDGTELYKHTITLAEQTAGGIDLDIVAGQLTQEKQYTVTYAFQGENNSTADTTSDPLTLRTIYTAPGEPDMQGPVFDANIVSKGLTNPGLTALGNTLPCVIPSYRGRADGDVIKPRVVLQSGTTPVDAAEVMIPYGGAGAQVDASYTRANLEALGGDGVAMFTYTVTDRAGNVSPPSKAISIDLFLTSPIGQLTAPTVTPLVGQNKDMVDDASARVLEVEVPPDTTLLARGDQIWILWGTARIPGGEVIDPADTHIVTIPYQIIRDEGQGSVAVSYEIYRASTLYGSSPLVPLTVNLDQPGGPDPDPLTPQNEALGPPEVRSASWPTTPPNEIPEPDSNLDAMFAVPWLTVAGPTKGAAAFVDGDQVQLFYAKTVDSTNTPFDTRTISLADVTAATELTYTLPASVIQANGSGIFKAYYIGVRSVANGVSNSSLSPAADVTVISSAGKPGGLTGLPAPTFDGLTRADYPVAAAGLAIMVPTDYVNAAEGDTITVTFTAKWGSQGQSGEDVKLAKYVETRTVGAGDMTAKSMRFTVLPAQALYLYPICLGEVVFEATNASGSAISPPALLIVDTRSNPAPPDDPDRPTKVWR
ncbi:hypothetical protein PHO31112_04779 [Pandoraea horticolens]|uniref:Uncharacterized protein n=1 Tax=Pandoraea horticolens TaxID=2508298 RepID=A0A5E4YUF7_9BURK|nr:hypothetical protein [Pandoraea horticolens]VVE52376.1 hypothetical protein PHO31112_04779 [Pandoraea horticolens]